MGFIITKISNVLLEQPHSDEFYKTFSNLKQIFREIPFLASLNGITLLNINMPATNHHNFLPN